MIAAQAELRRMLAKALVLAFCVAGFTAIAAILTGDFGETEGRVIVVSLGFAVFSGTASSGASLSSRTDRLRALGLGTIGLSATGFVLLVFALWNEGTDDAWRWFGAVGLAALAGSHASLLTRARRQTDSPTVQTLGTLAIVLGVLDAAIGILVITGQGDVDEGVVRLAAVLVVVLILTTILAPILRRLQQSPAAPMGSVHGFSDPLEPMTSDASERLGGDAYMAAPGVLAMAVLAAVARIETLNADAGNRAPEIRQECERLRVLAHEHMR